MTIGAKYACYSCAELLEMDMRLLPVERIREKLILVGWLNPTEHLLYRELERAVTRCAPNLCAHKILYGDRMTRDAMLWSMKDAIKSYLLYEYSIDVEAEAAAEQRLQVRKEAVAAAAAELDRLAGVSAPVSPLKSEAPLKPHAVYITVQGEQVNVAKSSEDPVSPASKQGSTPPQRAGSSSSDTSSNEAEEELEDNSVEARSVRRLIEFLDSGGQDKYCLYSIREALTEAAKANLPKDVKSVLNNRSTRGISFDDDISSAASGAVPPPPPKPMKLRPRQSSKALTSTPAPGPTAPKPAPTSKADLPFIPAKLMAWHALHYSHMRTNRSHSLTGWAAWAAGYIFGFLPEICRGALGVDPFGTSPASIFAAVACIYLAVTNYAVTLRYVLVSPVDFARRLAAMDLLQDIIDPMSPIATEFCLPQAGGASTETADSGAAPARAGAASGSGKPSAWIASTTSATGRTSGSKGTAGGRTSAPTMQLMNVAMMPMSRAAADRLAQLEDCMAADTDADAIKRRRSTRATSVTHRPAPLTRSRAASRNTAALWVGKGPGPGSPRPGTDSTGLPRAGVELTGTAFGTPAVPTTPAIDTAASQRPLLPTEQPPARPSTTGSRASRSSLASVASAVAGRASGTARLSFAMLQAAGTGLVAVLSPAPAISGPMAGDLSSTSGSGNGVSGGVNDDEDLGTHPMLQRVQSLHFDKDDVGASVAEQAVATGGRIEGWLAKRPLRGSDGNAPRGFKKVFSHAAWRRRYFIADAATRTVSYAEGPGQPPIHVIKLDSQCRASRYYGHGRAYEFELHLGTNQASVTVGLEHASDVSAPTLYAATSTAADLEAWLAFLNAVIDRAAADVAATAITATVENTGNSKGAAAAAPGTAAALKAELKQEQQREPERFGPSVPATVAPTVTVSGTSAPLLPPNVSESWSVATAVRPPAATTVAAPAVPARSGPKRQASKQRVLPAAAAPSIQTAGAALTSFGGRSSLPTMAEVEEAPSESPTTQAEPEQQEKTIEEPHTTASSTGTAAQQAHSGHADSVPLKSTPPASEEDSENADDTEKQAAKSRVRDSILARHRLLALGAGGKELNGQEIVKPRVFAPVLYGENIVSWALARSICLDFGLSFKERIQLYTAFFAVLVVCAILLLFFDFANASGNASLQLIMVANVAFGQLVFSLSLAVAIVRGSQLNASAALHRARLSRIESLVCDFLVASEDLRNRMLATAGPGRNVTALALDSAVMRQLRLTRDVLSSTSAALMIESAVAPASVLYIPANYALLSTFFSFSVSGTLSAAKALGM